MDSVEARCLEAFPAWLKSLAQDAVRLAAVVDDPALPEGARRGAAAALNYLFKSLDLIPDGLEDLGFVDDAFVFRAAAASVAEGGRAADASGTLARLAGDMGLVREFLGELTPKLEGYVAALGSTPSRGRAVGDILENPAVREDFVRDVRTFAEGYQAPAFHRDEKNLIKLRAFLSTKLK
jgi:uncharacterized membrane protein YkvA (DUF1232 family)